MTHTTNSNHKLFQSRNSRYKKLGRALLVAIIILIILPFFLRTFKLPVFSETFDRITPIKLEESVLSLGDSKVDFSKLFGQNGTNGEPGINGKDGKDGTTGQQGEKGDTGINGRNGVNGVQGLSGAASVTGLRGSDGVEGKKGDSGKDGLAGAKGVPGENGINGVQGPQGVQGPSGSLENFIANSPLVYNPTTQSIDILQATSTQNGFLTAADWVNFNNKLDVFSVANGLSINSGLIGLGGSLNQDTVIEQNGRRFILTNTTSNFPINDATFDIVSRTGTTLRLYSETSEAQIGTVGNNSLSFFTNSGTNFPNLTLNPGGTLQLWNYPNSRDDSNNNTPENFLYTGTGGRLLSAPISSIAGGGNLNDAYNFGGASQGNYINLTAGRPLQINPSGASAETVLEYDNTGGSGFGFGRLTNQGFNSYIYGNAGGATQLISSTGNNATLDIRSGLVGNEFLRLRYYDSLFANDLSSGLYAGYQSPIDFTNANAGSLYLQNNNTTNGAVYIKTSSSDNFGWERLLTTNDLSNVGNFATSDLTADGNRVHNFDGNTLTIQNTASTVLSAKNANQSNILELSAGQSSLTISDLITLGKSSEYTANLNDIFLSQSDYGNNRSTKIGVNYHPSSNLPTIYFSTDSGSYYFPRNNGFADQVLTTDGAGQLSWKTISGGDGSCTTQFNTCTGTGALASNSTGFANTAFGYEALNDNQIGAWNNAIGAFSLAGITNGNGNTGDGYATLFSLTNGDYNTAVGAQALSTLSTGNTNTVIGGLAALSFQSGNSNTIIGQSAASQFTNGSFNIGIGQGIEFTNNFGSNQLNIGNWIYGNNGSIGIGAINPTARLEVNSGFSNTSGLKLTNLTSASPTSIGQAIGVNANGDVVRITASSSCVVPGSGIDNVCTGLNALQVNTTGYNNAGFGAYALAANTVGYSNTALGRASLRNNASGIENSAVGLEAAYKNTTGLRNVAVGYQSLYDNQTGNANTAVGSNALSGATGGFNTAIGINAGYNITSGTANIAIGENTAIPNPTGSNQLNLGNAIFGTGLTGTVDSPAGLIGIGTSSPTNKLTVNDQNTNSVARFDGPGGTQCTIITGTGLSCTSDARLKNSIQSIPSGLEAVTKLNPVTFKWNAGAENFQPGFVAQEVEQIFPSLVTTNADGFKSLHQQGLTPYIVKSIQELDKKIEDIAAGKTLLTAGGIWSNEQIKVITDITARLEVVEIKNTEQDNKIKSLETENAELKLNQKEQENRLNELEKKLENLSSGR
jgi:hypothetical protein